MLFIKTSAEHLECKWKHRRHTSACGLVLRWCHGSRSITSVFPSNFFPDQNKEGKQPDPRWGGRIFSQTLSCPVLAPVKRRLLKVLAGTSLSWFIGRNDLSTLKARALSYSFHSMQNGIEQAGDTAKGKPVPLQTGERSILYVHREITSQKNPYTSPSTAYTPLHCNIASFWSDFLLSLTECEMNTRHQPNSGKILTVAGKILWSSNHADR